MNVQEITEKVNAKRAAFMTFCKEKPAPTADEIEAAEKMSAELDAEEKELTRVAALEERARQIDEKMAAERDAVKAGIIRPPLPSQDLARKGDSGIMEQRSLNVFANLSDIFFASEGFKTLYRAGSWPVGDFKFEAPATKSVPLRTFESKAAGDPIMTTNFNAIATDMRVAEHYIAEPSVYDLVNKQAVSASAYRFIQATLPVTGTAAPVAEGAVKPEVQLRWAPITLPLETIAEWTSVTVQALADIPGLREAIDNDLRGILLRTVDNQIINGSGVTPNLLGMLFVPGIQTQPWDTDILKTISNAILKLVTTGAGSPTVILMNPTDWQAIRLLNSNGMYFFGMPTEAGISRLFGVPVVTNNQVPVGFAIVADMRFVTFYQSMGVTFIVGWKNDDIIRNLQTIVCEIRGMLGVRRPQAIVSADLTAV
jgi:HK97 family phage major capsid protein